MNAPTTTDPLERLRGVRAEEQRLEGEKRRLIAMARQRGASWTEIGEVLGVSKQAAWQQYQQEITAVLDRVRTRGDLDEEEAFALAAQELREVRRQRRRQA
jgi:transposase-like protein